MKSMQTPRLGSFKAPFVHQPLGVSVAQCIKREKKQKDCFFHAGCTLVSHPLDL